MGKEKERERCREQGGEGGEQDRPIRVYKILNGEKENRDLLFTGLLQGENWGSRYFASQMPQNEMEREKLSGLKQYGVFVRCV